MSETHIRIDAARITGKVTRTPEGYLRGDAIVTRTGVFAYQNADGSVRKELRHPDDVFSQSHLDSLKSIPITVGHPSELVTAENAKELSHGMTGEKVRIDGNHIILPITITHRDAIDAVDGGVRELSLGYNVDLDCVSGKYDGEEYTHRQRSIVANHLAIVPRARAGAMARINMDGAAVQIINDQEKNMVKLKLDGIDYEAAPEVARALEKETARADTAEAAVKAAKSDADKVQARLDALQADHDKLKSERTDDAIREAAKVRVELVTKAARVCDGDLSHLSDREVMEKVITAKHDGVNLDGKSMDYISARFDAVIDSLAAQAIQDQRKATTERQDGSVVGSADEAKLRADEAIKNQWRGGKQ